MLKKIIFTVILAAYTALLLYGALSFEIDASPNTPGFDKVLHFAGFLVLSVLLAFTLGSYGLKWKFAISFVLAMAIGLFIELAQTGIPGREFSLLDLAADFIGIALGLVLAWGFSKK